LPLKIYQYYVAIYKVKSLEGGNKEVQAQNMTADRDTDVARNYLLLAKVRKNHEQHWGAHKVGVTYDGHATMFSTAQLFAEKRPLCPSSLRPPPIPSLDATTPYGPHDEQHRPMEIASGQ
jgi:hypothetical protein